MVIVDTSVWIDYFNGRYNKFTEKLEDLEKKKYDIFTTGIIITEILSGIRSSKDYKIIKEKLLQLPYVNLIYPSTYIESALIFKKGKKTGITIRKIIDCLIAQLAIENGLLLLHHDKNFDRIATFSKLKIY